MNTEIEYTIRDYPSNVEVYKTISENDEIIESGRVAHVTCTGDEPQWTLEDDEVGEWNEEDAMTRGTELGSYLRGLNNEEMEKWLSEYGHGML